MMTLIAVCCAVEPVMFAAIETFGSTIFWFGLHVMLGIAIVHLLGVSLKLEVNKWPTSIAILASVIAACSTGLVVAVQSPGLEDKIGISAYMIPGAICAFPVTWAMVLVTNRLLGRLVNMDHGETKTKP